MDGKLYSRRGHGSSVLETNWRSLPEVIAAWIGGSLVTEKAEMTVREFSTRPQRF
ncbi:MAG: hypothetical protein H7308_18225 [Chthonomonadaceae bacterium]|nr:hypothetical protein [Chthonomonadaceae bacterium]